MEVLDIVSFFKVLNIIIGTGIVIAYLYQVYYLIVGLLIKDKCNNNNDKKLKYAIMITARNEEDVIGELIDCLNEQTYDRSYYDIYVLADNCSDNTYQIAIDKGAIGYKRHNEHDVGKGYALDYLYHQIIKDKGDIYDGYMVFDADNIVDKNFIKAINNEFVDSDYDAITSYRNSKNFGNNWISSSNSIWFIREARFVNGPRKYLGTSCMISGTGFLVSKELMAENRGWPYYLLTEDIEFSCACVLDGKRIGYCSKAIVYDEQPTDFIQSWKQRLRWTKGFFQINKEYGGSLLKGIIKQKTSKFACYDSFMTIAPCVLLSVSLILYNVALIVISFLLPIPLNIKLRQLCLRFIISSLVGFFLQFFFMGLITVISEWKKINASTVQKLLSIIYFPFFQLTYIGVMIHAFFSKVKWEPIKHNSIKSLSEK